MNTNDTKPKILSANLFPVVGIGASAGGLEAFRKLLKAIPEDSGIAYVLVQHLHPSHDSLLPELLQKVTRIPVMQISDDIKVLPDHIYILPSNKMLVANDGVLQLSPRKESTKTERYHPIDLFFTSLAEVHQAHAIGVVLSGTATDGTLGLKAIKDHGGVSFAQDEASAAYDGMPHSAVQAGVVDFILPPEEIPKKLLELKNLISRSDSALQDDAIYKQIISILRMRKGTDFTYYKQTTIRRRIQRRMAIHKNYEPDAYLKYLRENKNEQDALFQDLLIPVSEFFRDKNIFDNLCSSVFPHIIKNKPNNEPIRVWVAACSTGEEAYSIAICLKEFLSGLKETPATTGTATDDEEPKKIPENHKIQIFATDISAQAIAKARKGIYDINEMASVSPERLQKFFTKTDGSYQVNKDIRELCVFAIHNFLKDPAFGKMDFVSCRNVLIYMEPYLQKKALTTFQYALNPKGFLLLGKSESVSSVPELFSAASKTDKLFTRKDIPAKFITGLARRKTQIIEKPKTNITRENMQTDFQKTADEIMLRQYMPPAVIVNELWDIVHFRGNTANFLEQTPGKPSHNLIKMAKPGLGFELRNILHKAKKDNTTVVRDNIPILINNSQHIISIEAVPLQNLVEPHYLILFHDDNTVANQPSSLTKRKSASNKVISDDKDLRIKHLEQELLQTRDDMRSITEDQEAANEELQSANEELLSSSEEMQSMNEELETSKEELQSSNEELTVLNQELSLLNEQVTASRNYAEAIVATIRQPLLVLDRNLRVKKANAAFYKTFLVEEKDTENVLIYNLGNKQWNIPQLRTLLEEILPQKSEFTDFEVTHTFSSIGERIILLNAIEITRIPEEEKLILLAIEDITERKQHLQMVAEHTKLLEEKVKQRTLELSAANEELQQKNEELLKSNHELESFTYISSHDLQEPLRKIQTFAALILEKEYAGLSDTGKDYFNRMHNAALRMQTLIQDLLSYSHTNITDRKYEITDLNKIVDDVKKDLMDTIVEKKAVINTDKLGPAHINPFQFRQVMNNLISNSLKFCKPGVPLIINIHSEIVLANKLQKRNPDLSTGLLLPKVKYCHICFSDNGIGFQPEYKEKIFDVFQRLHGKEEYPGTGIGLAIVKKIIENHNGFITATGEPGKGSTFDLYIPAEN